MKKNEVQKLLQEKDIRQWQLADALGISEYTLCKKLRHPLSEEFESEIVNAIEKIESE